MTTLNSAQQLVAAMAKGDRSALEPLYDTYSRPIFALLLRIVRDRSTAEELLQDVFVSAWQHAARFDPTRGDVLPWLLGIGHHAALNELRRRRRRPRTVDAVDEQAASTVATMPDDRPSPEDEVWFEIRRSDLRRCLGNLIEEDRRVIEMYAAGHSQSEISTLLVMPLGTVKTRMRRALRRLRDGAARQEFEWD